MVVFMEIKNIICISCPLGCPLQVEFDGVNIGSVTGNTCKRGEVYAKKELTNPTRIVTSTVRVTGSDVEMVSVKTKDDIPKGKIFECVKALKDVVVSSPVKVGDIIISNVADTGVDIVATRNA